MPFESPTGLTELPSRKLPIYLTDEQAYCFLVSMMAPDLGGDTMVELEVFDSYQDLVDLFKDFTPRFPALEADFKDSILQLFAGYTDD